MTPADDPCESCALYDAAIRGLLADWYDAGQPQHPSEHGRHIGAALAMYLEHQHSHQNA